MALSPFVGQRLTTFISSEDHSFIERLAEHIASGAVVPAIGQRFALDDAAQAIRALEAGQTSGKSVIVVRGNDGDSV
jgi:NADPH:quinone reductase-like Zn-dependent oxidoreductase